jgi:hypothetical protein
MFLGFCRKEKSCIKMQLLCSGPDGIRTRDLGLDRAACLATTPRVHAGKSLLYNHNTVKVLRYLQDLHKDEPGLLIYSFLRRVTSHGFAEMATL